MMNLRSRKSLIRSFVLIALILLAVARGSANVSADEPKTPRSHPFGQREHVVRQLNDEQTFVTIPAELQVVSQPWQRENAQMPYLVYMPEKDRLLMLVECRQPIQTAFITSDDHGKTWSERKWMSTDADGRPNGVALGLTYLGQGKLLAFPENVVTGQWSSQDYGETWKKADVRDTVTERYVWDPLLVIKDREGRVTQLVEGSYRPTGKARGLPSRDFSQAYLRSSVDEGRSWSNEFKVPQWLGVNEVSLIVAGNGDWVAACRLDEPPEYGKGDYADLYSGLGVSISKDQGKTWSERKVLHDFGRHHSSMILLPDGRIVMTYVVRAGYPKTEDGFPQFGIEAVVSGDHGQSWDLDHRYILADWQGNIRVDSGPTNGWCSPQSTSTVLLPDGAILTAFGTGHRNPKDAKVWLMDVALVRWRLAPATTTQPRD